MTYNALEQVAGINQHVQSNAAEQEAITQASGVQFTEYVQFGVHKKSAALALLPPPLSATASSTFLPVRPSAS